MLNLKLIQDDTCYISGLTEEMTSNSRSYSDWGVMDREEWMDGSIPGKGDSLCWHEDMATYMTESGEVWLEG